MTGWLGQWTNDFGRNSASCRLKSMMKRAAWSTLSEVKASDFWASTFATSAVDAERGGRITRLSSKSGRHWVRELKAVFRRYRSQPIERVINLINPVLRGWVNYFAVGHSSECFSFIKDWVEKKVRRQLAHAQKRKGFGWERWSRQWLYDTLGLFNGYRVRRDRPKVAPAG